MQYQAPPPPLLFNTVIFLWLHFVVLLSSRFCTRGGRIFSLYQHQSGWQMLTTHRGAVILYSTPTRLSTKPWKLPTAQVRLFGFVLNSFFTLRCLLERRPVACCCLSTAASPVCVKAHRRAANEPSPICADVSWLLAPSPRVLPQMVDALPCLSPDLNKQHNVCMVNAQKASEGKGLQPSAEGY